MHERCHGAVFSCCIGEGGLASIDIRLRQAQREVGDGIVVRCGNKPEGKVAQVKPRFLLEMQALHVDIKGVICEVIENDVG